MSQGTLGPQPQPPKVASFQAVVQDLITDLYPLHKLSGKAVVTAALAKAAQHFDIHLSEAKK